MNSLEPRDAREVAQPFQQAKGVGHIASSWSLTGLLDLDGCA